MQFWYQNSFLFSLTALVDPGRVTIPLCSDPEVLGRRAGYGKSMMFSWLQCYYCIRVLRVFGVHKVRLIIVSVFYEVMRTPETWQINVENLSCNQK